MSDGEARQGRRDEVAGPVSGGRSEPSVQSNGSGPQRSNGPSLVPGVVLLIVAAVLIVVVLVSPHSLPHWLRVTIALVAVLVVVALLAYCVVVFRSATRRGSGR